jgi:membrane protease YdiL (CAAX protease family)
LRLDDLSPYLAIAVYPAIVMFVFDWWGAVRRAREDKSFALRPEIKKKRETTGRYLFFFKFAILLLALWKLSGWRPLHNLLWVSTDSRSLLRLIVSGFAAGTIALACRRIFSMLSPRAAEDEKVSSYLEGPIVLWLGVFLAGGFAEEFWRAFAITSFVQSDHSAVSSDLVTALAFSFAHLSGLPPRILPGGFVAEAVVGLILGATFLWSGSVISPCLASILYYTVNLLILRKRSE